jgi:hypothetical protein
MNSMFEVITEDQYKAANVDYQASHSDDRVEGAGVSNHQMPADEAYPRSNLTYCEFCKGYYNEYHVERWEGVKST